MAQTDRLGLYNSYKGFGAEYSRDVTPDEMRTLSVYADLASVLSAVDSEPGVKLSAQRRRIIGRTDFRDAKLGLFYGTGISLGYCSDNLIAHKRQNMGFTAAFVLGTGTICYLPGNFDLQLGFTLEGGVQFRRDETYGNTVMSWYLDGIVRSLIPELVIYYKF